MLTIRDEQFKALSASHLDRDMVRYLRQRYPTTLAQKSDADLYQIGQASREIGGRHGITDDQDIGTVADLVVMYGPSFESQPWAAEVLSDSMLAGPRKTEILRQRVKAAGTRI